jgi:hypothetical protein
MNSYSFESILAAVSSSHELDLADSFLLSQVKFPPGALVWSSVGTGVWFRSWSLVVGALIDCFRSFHCCWIIRALSSRQSHGAAFS